MLFLKGNEGKQRREEVKNGRWHDGQLSLTQAGSQPVSMKDKCSWGTWEEVALLPGLNGFED